MHDTEVVLMASAHDDLHAEKIAAAREMINGVLGNFLLKQNISPEQISIIDGFLFIFNEPDFSRWHSLNWWEQRKCVLAIKDTRIYTGRAHAMLERTRYAPFLDYSDKMVAKSTGLDVKRAWMQKRLVEKESFWNAIDTISHAAYFKNKYQSMYPALCMMLCAVKNSSGSQTVLVLGIDNGTGFLYKKKSRDSTLIRLFYKLYKLLFRRGVFYIGGMELGLMETEGELSCLGDGAVVFQSW